MAPDDSRSERAKQRIRDWILRGRYEPGERLPTHTELVAELGISGATVQNVLNDLKEEGFIRSRRRSGSFVTEHPPHLFDYALLYSRSRSEALQNAFLRRLSAVARAVSQKGPRTLRTYFGVDAHGNTEGFVRALQNVRSGHLAGLIPIMPTPALGRTVLFQEAGIPIVALDPDQPVKGAYRLVLDRTNYLGKALDYLAERGRRRIGIITVVGLTGELETFEDQVEAREMVTCPHWMQITELRAASYMANTAHLLMKCGNPGPPDGLIIRDDNLVSSVIVGLNAAGVRIGRDVDVVAHANFPVENRPPGPVKLLGYDVRELIWAAIGLVDRARSGARVPDLTRIRAVMEDDVREPEALAGWEAMAHAR
jgi:DNA-binding LacI/PurR family transcriptional regulator